MDEQYLTILSVGQMVGAKDSAQLEVIKNYGTSATATDLCLLTGGIVDDDKFIPEDRSLTGRTSFFWTRTPHGEKEVYDIYRHGAISVMASDWRCRAIRPALEMSAISDKQSLTRIPGYNKTEEVEFGEYPQYAVNSRMQKVLEKVYISGMYKTGKNYTFDGAENNAHNTPFKPVSYDEYEYKGKKYVRIKANISSGNDIPVKLSNSIKYKNGDYVWIEVSPVKWLVDDQTQLLVSKVGLVSGIRFLDLNEYLNTYMKHDLMENGELKLNTEMKAEEKDKIKDNLHESKRERIDRLMLAYQKIKEAAELMNDRDADLNLEKIKIDSLESLIFKNNGNPTEKGCIEFDDYFRDNTILRMIDLSKLDLTNVDITNMDFSGTNVHIDPQTIYNKDMTKVNALDVRFSPFLDSFEGVILDGAVINDHDALIELDKLKSCNDDTIIKDEIISNKIK